MVPQKILSKYHAKVVNMMRSYLKWCYNDYIYLQYTNAVKIKLPWPLHIPSITFISYIWCIILICFVHIFVENRVFSQKIFGAQARFAETEIFVASLTTTTIIISTLLNFELVEFTHSHVYVGCLYCKKYLSYLKYQYFFSKRLHSIDLMKSQGSVISQYCSNKN